MGLAHNQYSTMTKAAVSGEFSNWTDKLPHIIDELSQFDFNGIIQGEILADHLLTTDQNFGFTTGTLHADNAVERQKENKLKLVIYDMPSYDNTYINRYNELEKMFDKVGNLKYVSLNPILVINNNNEIEKCFDDLVSIGKEGVIAYEMSAKYKHSLTSCQRNKGVLKIKAASEKEVLCIEKIEGIGKYTNTLGALRCVDSDGRDFHVGSFSIDDTQRQFIWDNVDVPFVCEIIYYQMTDTSYKLPRFTRYRPDKDVESWNPE